MLSAWDLEYMRTSAEELMPDTCDILSVTKTIGAGGGFTQTWGTAIASLACRADYLSGVKQLAGGALQPFRELSILVPYDTSVTTDNRVKWDGGEYAVDNVNTNSWIACKFLEVHAAE